MSSASPGDFGLDTISVGEVVPDIGDIADFVVDFLESVLELYEVLW